MNRFQLENLYEINGLNNYKLKTTEDIIKCHGINYKDVDGYNRLDDVNKANYEKFIVKIFNAWGLESRSTLIPKGIYFVEHVEHLVIEDLDDDNFIISGATIYAIDRNGLKYVLHDWSDDDYKELPIVRNEISKYLRFEYEHDGRKEWLHVTDQGEEWY